MTIRIFIPRDSGAIAVGADEVATELENFARKRRVPIEIVRTGSRGLYWLEPMLEVATPAGRAGLRTADAGRCRFGAGCDRRPTARIRCGLASPKKSPG